MEVYLDNAATTKTMDEVVVKISEVFSKVYGNSSSLHNRGIEAEKIVNEARDILSRLLKVDKSEIYFTSGGTESNNMAMIGISKAYIRSGKHIIISSLEHPSISATAKYLEEEGFEITTIPVDENGCLKIEELEKAIRKDTILVSIMHVNNEIGIINPIEKIGQIIKDKNPNTIFHVDAIQSFGKLNIYPKKGFIDAISISGHKLHGPKGVGALYINKKIKIKPIMFGGNHQAGLRPGTENTPGIAGLAFSANLMYNNIDKYQENLSKFKQRLKNGILNNIENTFVNGSDGIDSANNILNIRFEGVKGEVLLHSLEAKGIYVSTGSACSSNKSNPSATLTALGLDNSQIDSSIRFSFSIYNTADEIDYCIEQLKEIVPSLRRFIKK